MISYFLKKLLFARQFSIIDGKVQILGKKQVILPYEIFLILESKKSSYKSIKKEMRILTDEFAVKLATTEDGLLKNILDVFETFGLGKLDVVDLDNDNGRCIVRVFNSPFQQTSFKTKFDITAAIIAGMFSYFFRKDVDGKKTPIRGLDYIEYIVS